MPGRTTYDIFCSAHARYDFDRINALVPGKRSHLVGLCRCVNEYEGRWMDRCMMPSLLLADSGTQVFALRSFNIKAFHTLALMWTDHVTSIFTAPPPSPSLQTSTNTHAYIMIVAMTNYANTTYIALHSGAAHVTVLREPASHFVSSWNYWGTANHIHQKSGMHVTMDQLLDDPVTWWPRAYGSDQVCGVRARAFGSCACWQDITRGTLVIMKLVQCSTSPTLPIPIS